MRFSSLIIFILALTACQKTEVQSQSQTVSKQAVKKEALALHPEEGLVYFDDKPFTGTSVSHYPNGVPASSCEYVKGKKHGLYRKWFENAMLSFESTYVNGKKHGTTRTWWKNGKLRSISKYDRGVPDGVQEQWYISGAKFKKMQLSHGREEGLQQSWRENGKVYNNYEAKNGRIFGLKRASLCYQVEDEKIQYSDS